MTSAKRQVAVIIPARFASSRYPGKPLAMLRGASGEAKPLIRRSWEAAMRVPGVASVHIATDSAEIAEAARGFGAGVLMTSDRCRDGTERCAEALAALGEAVEMIVNLQGDAPLTPPGYVTALIEAMLGPQRPAMVTPAVRIDAAHARKLQADAARGIVGGTSVVSDAAGRALYFSKQLIPYFAEAALAEGRSPVRLHLGVYAYTPAALRAYVEAAPSELELLEGLEQLRFLDRGIPVRVVEVSPPGWEMWELNNPSDIAPIEAALAAMGVE
jgi:3-deoxy-manno-octulosonate cytidylyltransferase (CMP-KDO synthetase)